MARSMTVYIEIITRIKFLCMLIFLFQFFQSGRPLFAPNVFLSGIPKAQQLSNQGPPVPEYAPDPAVGFSEFSAPSMPCLTG